MNIGFDLDKVFINYPPLISANIIDSLYRKKSSQDLTYRIPGKMEQSIRVLSHHPIFRPPIKENMFLLRRITQDKKNNYYLISSRFSFLKKRTDSLVKNFKLNNYFSSLHFNYKDQQPHIFKDKKIKELKINIYIDDDLNLLKYLSSKNKNVKFYWLNPKKAEKISSNLYAITSIDKILPK